MKNLKKLTMLLLVVATVFALASCGDKKDGGETGKAEGPYPVTITTYDGDGQEIKETFDKAPDKVIAVYQGNIETMIALGLEDKVIASYGLDNEVKPEWKAGFEKMHYQNKPFAPDKELVLSQKPDFIFSWGSLFGPKTLGSGKDWVDKGINIYINTNTRKDGSRTLDNEYNDILNIGKIFNVEKKATELVDSMKDKIKKVKDQVGKDQSVSVAILEPEKEGTLRNYGKESLGGDMVTQLGGKLVAPDAKSMGKEDLLKADPDTIFVVYMAYAGDNPEEVKAKQLDAIMKDPAFASLKAVKNNNVHLIMLGDMYASGPRTADGIEAFAKGMYPNIKL